MAPRHSALCSPREPCWACEPRGGPGSSFCEAKTGNVALFGILFLAFFWCLGAINACVQGMERANLLDALGPCRARAIQGSFPSGAPPDTGENRQKVCFLVLFRYFQERWGPSGAQKGPKLGIRAALVMPMAAHIILEVMATSLKKLGPAAPPSSRPISSSSRAFDA